MEHGAWGMGQKRLQKQREKLISPAPISPPPHLPNSTKPRFTQEERYDNDD